MVVGLDLGSANVGICIPSKRSRILREPAVVALEPRSNRVLAIGQPADQMRNRTTGTIEVVRPMEQRLAAAPHLVQLLVRHVLQKALGWRWRGHTVSLSVPVTLSELEKETLRQAITAAGANKVNMVWTPLAAGRGGSPPEAANRGLFVVDIGARRTQAALLMMGTLLTSRAVRVGGDDLNTAIIRWLRQEKHLSIGDPQAEALKLEIGTAGKSREYALTSVTGQDVRTGEPVTLGVSSEDVAAAVREPIARIHTLVRKVLAETPPEFATDLLDHGLLLTGGGARLYGLPESLSTATGLPVKVAPDPETCGVLGSARVEQP